MSDQSKNENLYLKWLDNTLSDKELDVLKKSEDFTVFDQIINETDSWSLPEPKNSYHDFQRKIKKQAPKKGKIVRLFSFIKVAASILLLIGTTYFMQYRFFDTTQYSSLNQEIKNIVLPDGSKVILNSNSTLEFNNYNWNKNRAVAIEGQAYFDIQKNKGDFKVTFKNGTVKVLGTQFDVFSHQKFTAVNCYEGKIQTAINKSEYTLTANMGIKSNGNTIEETIVKNTTPTWISNFTSFNNVPLQEVLNSLSLKYGITYQFENKESIQKVFTGKFVNNDLDLALEMVLSPLSLNYSKTSSVIYITYK